MEQFAGKVWSVLVALVLLRSVEPLVQGVPEKSMNEEGVLLLIQMQGHSAAAERNAVSYLVEHTEAAPLDQEGIEDRRRPIAGLLAALGVGRVPMRYHRVLLGSIHHSED